tara:strand:- start:2501 stop:2737 length:237 start_codon:yes stop_codon:yes gene_type:complete
MKYIVKSTKRGSNKFFVQEIDFQHITMMFTLKKHGEEETDSMIEKVAFLDIGESYAHNFGEDSQDHYYGSSFLFKRIG